VAKAQDWDLRWSGQEKRSRSIIGGYSPADETDQSMLRESGIVFVDSVPDVDMNV
jgi:hypothetical protein